MSILIKRIDSSSGGGSSKGYPPGNINIIKKMGLNTKAYLRWSDPDNIIVGNQTLSTWNSTIIVRKEGSVPKSPTDGAVVITNTTKNKYKDTDLVDSGLTNGKTYYYRFFTTNTDKLYNTDSSMIYDIKIIQADPILKNNSWETINTVSEAGIASSIWNIGDEINIELKADTVYFSDQTITLQIWDFNHFDKSDGSGKAGICFGMKDLMKEQQRLDSNHYEGTLFHSSIKKRILNLTIPNLQNVIKKVNIYTNPGGYYSQSSVGEMTSDDLFLPGHTEVFGPNDVVDQSKTESGQHQIKIFTNTNNMIKTLIGKTAAPAYQCWWTRSPFYNNSGSFWYVSGNVSQIASDAKYGICFCFNV